MACRRTNRVNCTTDVAAPVVPCQPRGHWREGPEHPFKTGPSPPTSNGYTWKKALGSHDIECVDGRTSRCKWLVHDNERQVYNEECLPFRRDYIEFTVPATSKDVSRLGVRTFVWLCSVS